MRTTIHAPSSHTVNPLRQPIEIHSLSTSLIFLTCPCSRTIFTVSTRYAGAFRPAIKGFEVACDTETSITQLRGGALASLQVTLSFGCFLSPAIPSFIKSSSASVLTIPFLGFLPNEKFLTAQAPVQQHSQKIHALRGLVKNAFTLHYCTGCSRYVPDYSHKRSLRMSQRDNTGSIPFLRQYSGFYHT